MVQAMSDRTNTFLFQWKFTYKCWSQMHIRIKVIRSDLKLLATFLPIFVTGSEWPISACDFTSTVTESGVTCVWIILGEAKSSSTLHNSIVCLDNVKKKLPSQADLKNNCILAGPVFRSAFLSWLFPLTGITNWWLMEGKQPSIII